MDKRTDQSDSRGKTYKDEDEYRPRKEKAPNLDPRSMPITKRRRWQKKKGRRP